MAAGQLQPLVMSRCCFAFNRARSDDQMSGTGLRPKQSPVLAACARRKKPKHPLAQDQPCLPASWQGVGAETSMPCGPWGGSCGTTTAFGSKSYLPSPEVLTPMRQEFRTGKPRELPKIIDKNSSPGEIIG
jgi:hypothetical protein